jgi:nicotinamide mononucleotide transporter
MSTALIIEILATVANLAYLIFLIQEKIICWSFGIVGSLLSIYLFVDVKLYSEAVLYSYYVIVGVWGWIYWQRKDAANNNPIVSWGIPAHLIVILITLSIGLCGGYVSSHYTDSERSYIDALTTTFSFVATYLEVKKVRESWFYWIVINAVSIWLYQDRSLDIYAGLIGIYTIMSVWGLVRWWKVYQQQLVSR